jgi:SAM-dependent methyltransferase
LGCGTGTQSLLFALLGADVIGVDLDEEALNILNKRKAFYEDRSGRKLNLRMYKANSLDVNYANISPIEGIYSMFAFNMMKPSRSLLEKIAPHTNNRCRLAILDGNNVSWIPRIFSSRQRPGCLSPIEFEDVLKNHSFDIISHKAGFVLPPAFWLFELGDILRRIDGFLGRSWTLSISHQVLAEKNEREPS